MIKSAPTEGEMFAFQDPEDYGRLRSILEAAGYTDAGILEI